MLHRYLIIFLGIFLEQYLIINREDSSIPRPFVYIYPHSQTKLFLCTTMYREDPELMAHYLKCLSRVNSANRKYNSIETHIVVDDAFTVSGSLNAHAQTFIDLCKEMLVNSTVTQEIRMPYGSQILVTLEDGMFVYLHFKDCLKVGNIFGQLNPFIHG